MTVKELVLGALFLRAARNQERHQRQRQQRQQREKEQRAQAAHERETAASPAARAGTGRFNAALHLVRDAFTEWKADKAPRMGAALSYYTVFALAPMLLVAISVAGLVLGTEAAQGRIIDELRGLLGTDAAALVQRMLARSSRRADGVIGTVVGVGTLLLGATAVMIELEAALNAVWKVAPRRGLRGMLKDRLLSLGLVLSLGFLMVVSLAASAVLGAVGGLLDRVSFPGAAIIGQVSGNLVSLGVIALFFALVFKFLPNTTIAWRDVWFGALVTSALFHIGKIAIGLYLGRATIASTFGAAGSLAVLLVWVYYSAQIVLFGAEITHLFASRYGTTATPSRK
jgi:membrane protein